MIAANQYGLCNRLKALATVARFSGEFRVYWEMTPGVLNCKINDLLEIKQLIQEKKPFAQGSLLYPSWRLGVADSDDIPNGFSDFAEYGGVSHLFKSDPLRRSIDLEYHRIPQDLIDAYVKVFSQIKPTEALAEKIHHFHEQFDEDTVSVNIRTWNDDAFRRKQFFNLNAYVMEMEKFPEKSKFFVTSDSGEVKEKLAEIFPGRVLIYPRVSDIDTSRDSVQGMQEDVIELFLVAMNNTIIGSYLSTYTEVAWWLGKAKAKVILPLPGERTRVYSSP